jgi:hypothetical protein
MFCHLFIYRVFLSVLGVLAALIDRTEIAGWGCYSRGKSMLHATEGLQSRCTMHIIYSTFICITVHTYSDRDPVWFLNMSKACIMEIINCILWCFLTPFFNEPGSVDWTWLRVPIDVSIYIIHVRFFIVVNASISCGNPQVHSLIWPQFDTPLVDDYGWWSVTFEWNVFPLLNCISIALALNWEWSQLVFSNTSPWGPFCSILSTPAPWGDCDGFFHPRRGVGRQVRWDFIPNQPNQQGIARSWDA